MKEPPPSDPRPKYPPRPATGGEILLGVAKGLSGLALAVLALLALFIGGLFLLMASSGWTKGRPLRGRHRRPPARPTPMASPEEAAARHFRAMAQDEYESIATFSELAMDLMAAGAPLSLVSRCHEAALDEARHTTLCLALARSLDGREEGVGVVPGLRTARGRPRWRTALLCRLAVESYHDGCLGEGSSARALARLAREAERPALREALRVLAREEARHAQLGWDVLRWCQQEGGAVVARAVAMVRAHAARRPPPQRSSADGADLRRLGVPDAALRALAYRAASANFDRRAAEGGALSPAAS